MSIKIYHDIAVDLSACAFLEPYLKRQLCIKDDDLPLQPRAAVCVLTEESPKDTAQAMRGYAEANHLPLLIIRCPYIIGTGMDSLPRRIAEGIFHGTFVHIRGNEARISVVHAVDVARAIALGAGLSGEYTLTDGIDPTIHDLADALAYRLDDKRIITIKPRWARLWYGGRYFKTLTSDHVAESTISAILPDLAPVSVTDYLYHHVYDETSL